MELPYGDKLNTMTDNLCTGLCSTITVQRFFICGISIKVMHTALNREKKGQYLYPVPLAVMGKEYIPFVVVKNIDGTHIGYVSIRQYSFIDR